MKQKKFHISKPYMIIGNGDNMKLLDFSIKEGHWQHLATGKVTIYDCEDGTEQIRVKDNKKTQIYSYDPNRPEEFIRKITECTIVRDFKCGTIVLDSNFGKEKGLTGYLIDKDNTIIFGYEIIPGMYFLYLNNHDVETDCKVIKNSLFVLGRGRVVVKKISKDKTCFNTHIYYDYIETGDFHLFRKHDTIFDIFDKNGITPLEAYFKNNVAPMYTIHTNIHGIPVVFELTKDADYRLVKFNNVEDIRSILTIKENHFNYTITVEGKTKETFLYVSNKNSLEKI